MRGWIWSWCYFGMMMCMESWNGLERIKYSCREIISFNRFLRFGFGFGFGFGFVTLRCLILGGLG